MEFISLEAATFTMGTDDGVGFTDDYEGPSTEVKVPSFEIATTTVTNKDFAEFVEATDYETLAERIGTSFVFYQLVSEKDRKTAVQVPNLDWWLLVKGADWRHPHGPESDLEGKAEHPVVHIALEDALAFCEWKGCSLPTEAEWEYACRAGSTTMYPWGDDLYEGDKVHANIWQGDFPTHNTLKDGYLATAPVKSFEPNAFGLYQMIGNVWEWCRNPRRVLLDDFNHQDFKLEEAPQSGDYAIRGGSYLCHASYCNRYRSAGRTGVDCTSSSSHLGFRCIREK